MKLEEFKKYKKIVESRRPESLQNYEEAVKIQQWMLDSGRIDEGFWGSIWSWLKRNFSVTGARLSNLAEEYEKELIEETRAEYDTLAAPTIASKIRRSNYSKLSRDIEERMNIIAGDDEDYRELARTLINKKDIKVKKLMLSEYGGKMDPSELSSLKSYVDEEETKNEKEYNAAFKKASKETQDLIKDNVDYLKRKIGDDRKYYSQADVDSPEAALVLGKALGLYITILGQRDKTISLDNKTILSYSKMFVEAVIELSKKLESSEVSLEAAIRAVKNALYKGMQQDKPETFDKLKATAFGVAKSSLEGKTSAEDVESTVKKETTGAATPEVLTKSEVKDAVNTAVDSSGKDPNASKVVETIKDAVKLMFKTNLSVLVRKVNNTVDKFNSKDENVRERLVGQFDYNADKDDKLAHVDEAGLKTLSEDFINIAGAIVPYFETITHDKSFAITSQVIFEIYAAKKDPLGKLHQADIDTILKNIKIKENL